MRTQDGNIVVIDSPAGKGFEIYQTDENGLEMYQGTIPEKDAGKIRDTLLRRAVLKHEKLLAKERSTRDRARWEHRFAGELRSATIRLAAANPELREHLLPLLKESAGKTYAEAKTAVMDYLKSKGWKLSDPKLKVPHATSPDGKIRFWFKTQAVYFTSGGSPHNLNGARTVSYDTNEIKKMTPQQYVEDAEAFARRED